MRQTAAIAFHLYVHPKSVAKMKAKIRGLTSRSNGLGNDYRKRTGSQLMTALLLDY